MFFRIGPGAPVVAVRGAHTDGGKRERKVPSVACRQRISFQATLAAAGGFEIATTAGFMIGAASRPLPAVVDGFLSTLPRAGEFAKFRVSVWCSWRRE